MPATWQLHAWLKEDEQVSLAAFADAHVRWGGGVPFARAEQTHTYHHAYTRVDVSPPRKLQVFQLRCVRARAARVWPGAARAREPPAPRVVTTALLWLRRLIRPQMGESAAGRVGYSIRHIQVLGPGPGASPPGAGAASAAGPGTG
jgi:hypothetical protein